VIDFFYFEAPKNRFKRYFNFAKTIAKTIEERFDYTHPSRHDYRLRFPQYLSSQSRGHLSHKLGVKRVAILTDNPNNISGVTHAYVKKVIKLSHNADGFFSFRTP
jgi:hypothetical protein